MQHTASTESHWRTGTSSWMPARGSSLGSRPAAAAPNQICTKSWASSSFSKASSSQRWRRPTCSSAPTGIYRSSSHCSSPWQRLAPPCRSSRRSWSSRSSIDLRKLCTAPSTRASTISRKTAPNSTSQKGSRSLRASTPHLSSKARAPLPNSTVSSPNSGACGYSATPAPSSSSSSSSPPSPSSPSARSCAIPAELQGIKWGFPCGAMRYRIPGKSKMKVRRHNPRQVYYEGTHVTAYNTPSSRCWHTGIMQYNVESGEGLHKVVDT